jgi:hypothetical protein
MQTMKLKSKLFGALLVAVTAALPLAPPVQAQTAPTPTVVDKDGYTVLFNGKDLTGWKAKPDGWKVEDGVLTWQKGAGDLWTEGRYGDFVLELDFKVEKGTNSGVFIRTDSTKEWLHTGMEIQVMDSFGKNALGKHDVAALYDIQAAAKNTQKPVGEWNHYKITAKGPKLTVELNGEVVNEVDLDKWTEAGKNPDGTKNKFKYAYKEMKREGHIGLQDHGNPVWYRNIRIKELKD